MEAGRFMDLWTNDIKDAVSVLCGCDSVLSDARLGDVAERIESGGTLLEPIDCEGWGALEVWRVRVPGMDAAYRHCVFERFAEGSQFDRLRAWRGDGIFAIALDGRGFHGQQGRSWQCGAGNLYLSVALPASIGIERVNEVMALPSLSVIDALKPLMRVVPEMKQPNDVVVCDVRGARKLAGCLTEVAVVGERIVQVRYGIGIDLWNAPELADSLHLQACCVREFIREELAGRTWAALYHEVLFGVLGYVSRGLARLSGMDSEGNEVSSGGV